MAGGLAIIAICPIWSDLARLIIDLNAGWVINNSPYTSFDDLRGSNYQNNITKYRNTIDIVSDFENIVSTIINNPKIIDQKRLNAYEGVRKNYNIKKLAMKWKDILERTNRYKNI